MGAARTITTPTPAAANEAIDEAPAGAPRPRDTIDTQMGRALLWALAAGAAYALSYAWYESLPWKGTDYAWPALIGVALGGGYLAAIGLFLRHARGWYELPLFAWRLFYRIALRTAPILGLLMAFGPSTHPPAAYIGSSELLLAASSAKEAMRESYRGGTPLEHIGVGVKVSRFGSVGAGFVARDGTIELASTRYNLRVFLTPRLVTIASEPRPQLMWDCDGEPRRLMPRYCRGEPVAPR